MHDCICIAYAAWMHMQRTQCLEVVLKKGEREEEEEGDEKG